LKWGRAWDQTSKLIVSNSAKHYVLHEQRLRGHSNNMWHSRGGGRATWQCHQMQQGGEGVSRSVTWHFFPKCLSLFLHFVLVFWRNTASFFWKIKMSRHTWGKGSKISQKSVTNYLMTLRWVLKLPFLILIKKLGINVWLYVMIFLVSSSRSLGMLDREILVSFSIRIPLRIPAPEIFFLTFFH